MSLVSIKNALCDKFITWTLFYGYHLLFYRYQSGIYKTLNNVLNTIFISKKSMTI